ncbi:Bug family tripartite tricarboxylate transporter substrate binding protein [Roseomonas marmotae]|uniref:Tripartite tricarboxylate transporter substrate binding protein n=1 Tax=Roseomonas marmotae TaxID=2768161 RepID=A0ABS3K712_9PROT|nr:tripartite tricarboxylate transporter substrate binding protein [Roseomonas marmotae]MBO1073242.1 tripartite tricarboxylate transporter substrate binding protein [Roseomonas marmotae]QTI79134.1 tripartite tricarboxylate transporter substrate binding protein [Roseomonas marmotae]
MSLGRRETLRLGGLAAMALTAPWNAARAQGQATLPDKPIRLIVPNAAGGVADLTARTVGQGLSERLKQPVVIENRPGAGGIVAGQALISSPADGSTLMVATNAHAISASLFRSLPFDPIRDFAPVGLMGTFAIAILVAPNSPIRTAQDLIAQLKKDPTSTNIGTISVGSTQNLAAELFKTTAGVEAVTVPFNGTPALLTALLRGDVTAAFEIVAPITGQIRDGSLRAVAVTSASRAANLPDVPALREAGLADFDVSSWNAVVAPARTPAPVIALINREMNAVLADPAIRGKLLEAGVEAKADDSAALGRLLTSEAEKWRAVIERAGIEKQ